MSRTRLTCAVLLLSAGCILSAAVLVWANRVELADSFRAALHWETALLVWLTLFGVTLLHDAHRACYHCAFDAFASWRVLGDDLWIGAPRQTDFRDALPVEILRSAGAR